MPRHSIPEVLPFGIRRRRAPKDRKLSNLELLFVVLTILALNSLASWVARTDSWIKTAQAEFPAPRLLAQPLADVRTPPLAGKPSEFLKFAGGLDLAILAGPVKCHTCDPVHADGQLDAERVAAPISMAAISPAPDRVHDSGLAVSAAETTLHARRLPDTIEELTQGKPGTEVVTVEGEPETPLPPLGATTLALKDITSAEPVLRASPAYKQVSIKRRRTKPPAHARLTTASAPKLYSQKQYAQAPRWAAKMFDSNWQTKAFAYQ